MEIRKYLDIHTHYRKGKENKNSIISLSACNDKDLITNLIKNNSDQPVSVGLHPWHLTENWETDFNKLFLPTVKKLHTVAIGEAGLDSRCEVPFDRQLEAFKVQADFANKERLPLIIHCVKAIDQIIACHRHIKPHEPWIIHGFRGKSAQAKQLLSLGFSLSFGVHFHSEALAICPLERLYIESDESALSIQKIYEQIAKVIGKTGESLQNEILNLS